MRDYGKVNFKGVVYDLKCEPFISNKGTDGGIVYYAHAERDGKKYRVMWNTTIMKCLDSEEQKRLKELEEQGIKSFYCEDGSNACDWDNADAVEEI